MSLTLVSGGTCADGRLRFDRDSAELAHTYDNVGLMHYHLGLILADALQFARGENVLDIGCGTGRLSTYVARRVSPHGRVIGIDPLPLRIALAQRRAHEAGIGAEAFTAIECRGEDLSAFTTASFDVVYLNCAFHWMQDSERMLREARRVLRHGGRIGFNTRLSDRPHQFNRELDLALAELGIRRAQPTATRPPPGSEVGAMLENAGFSHCQMRMQTLVTFFDDVERVIAQANSVASGNYLSDLGADDRRRVCDLLAQRLERLRTHQGLRLERYMLYVTARR